MTGETFARFETALFRRIFIMTNAPELQERRGAVAALDTLIEVMSTNEETKVIKVANTFKSMIATNTDG